MAKRREEPNRLAETLEALAKMPVPPPPTWEEKFRTAMYNLGYTAQRVGFPRRSLLSDVLYADEFYLGYDQSKKDQEEGY